MTKRKQGTRSPQPEAEMVKIVRRGLRRQKADADRSRRVTAAERRALEDASDNARCPVRKVEGALCDLWGQLGAFLETDEGRAEQARWREAVEALEQYVLSVHAFSPRGAILQAAVALRRIEQSLPMAATALSETAVGLRGLRASVRSLIYKLVAGGSRGPEPEDEAYRLLLKLHADDKAPHRHGIYAPTRKAELGA